MASRPLYAVFGQPIAHSLSPRIHAMFAAQFGIALDYRAIEASRDDFAHALNAFAREGGIGANVTLPLKEDALALCAEASDRARRSGSVNTLIRQGAGWRGDSTDGVGLLRDLRERCGIDPEDCRCLLLGAGGAARAVLFALVDAGVEALIVANRTLARANALAVASASPNVEAIEWAALRDAGAFDLVLHATAAGHEGAAPSLPPSLATDALCYDLSYGEAARPFLRWAEAAGAARVEDGLGMLVRQAAESFRIWHRVAPETAGVFDAMRRVRPLAIDGA